ncbi:hypothetical protein PR001_g492 [Phytophthora rubi]|uniref:Reverse transcriptase domain-containing protein n=1 Tax=Phytophthora rubi TaxID=129364 RepID=A0A6A3PDH5_9STRA|nr:hypothetical protein PR001_g492 [Phytophthora rubi]
MVVTEDAASIAVVEAGASDSTSNTRTRPKGADPRNTRAARYAVQSFPALETGGNPVAPLVREFIDIFPDMVPTVLPPDRGGRHEIYSCLARTTGGWRIVHAFNKINDATILAQTLIPREGMMLDTMTGSTKFSAVDLMDGFYQIVMRDADVPLTAFSTLSGML